MKNELGLGGRGTLFSATGGKAYRLRYVKGDGKISDIIRAKGISLSASAAKLLQPDTITDISLNPRNTCHIPQTLFKRKVTNDTPIITKDIHKIFRYTDCKRIRDFETNTTIPIGTVE